MLSMRDSVLACLRMRVVTVSSRQATQTFRSLANGRRPCYPHSSSGTNTTQTNSIFRRAFASQSGSSYWTSQTSARHAILGIIGINTAVFAAWQYAIYGKDRKLLTLLNENTMLSLQNIREGRYHTLLTSAFSHVGFMHFLFNMVTLNAFGSVMSFMPGINGIHMISIVVGSGLAGSLAWLYQQSGSTRARGQALGASGAVMGAGAAATCLMPLAPMSFMFIPVPVPLFVLTGAYFAIDAYYLDSRGRIGHAAHLGGSVFGLVFYFAFLRRFGGIWQMMRRGLRK